MRRRTRTLLFGALALFVLGGGLYLARGMFSASPAAQTAPAAPQAGPPGCGTAGATPCPGSLVVAASPAVVTAPLRPAAARTHPASPGTSASASPAGPSPTLTAPAGGTGGAGGTGAGTPMSGAPRTTPPSSAASPAATQSSPPASQDGSAAGQVLALINQARASAGLPALTVTTGLDASAAAHNTRMAGGCGLSHQCSGEPAIGDRETAAGVHWTAAGENIGEGGPQADTDSAIAQMAVGLTQSMLNEKPPDDGHRQNILSSSYTHIGIAVLRDSSGTVWLTQDFSN
jgi:uncharacterized protein YkwD